MNDVERFSCALALFKALKPHPEHMEEAHHLLDAMLNVIGICTCDDEDPGGGEPNELPTPPITIH